MLSNRFGAALLLALAGTSTGFGQITGDLRGVVVDPTGAVVPQAKVSLRSQETGEGRTTTLNEAGEFSFGLLRIGMYEARAEAAGFSIATAPAEIRAGEITNVRLALEVGQVTEMIVVSGAVTPLNVDNAQMQTSVSGERIQEIPVGRNPNLFALTAPGVAPVSTNNPFLSSGSFNANGGRGRGNNVMVDGITATDVSATGTGGPLDPLNFSAIKEVKVITNSFSAEYGRNSTSQLIYLTKNGTNALHGELFEFFRNDVLNARPFFDTTGKTNTLRQNSYGYAIGGPIYIPKVIDGRNRLFWFADYQGIKTRGAGATRIARVPTPQQMAGITDPSSRSLVQQYQLPSSLTGQITTSAPNTTDFWQWAVRGDVQISQNDSLWVRYSSVPRNVVASSSLTFVQTSLPGFGASSQLNPRQATAAHTHVFGSRAVNEARFGYGQSNPGFVIDTPYPLGARILFADGSVSSFGVYEGLPQGREQRTYQINDNVSFMLGRHNFKTGVEYYYLQADSFQASFHRPTLQFANFADFQAGRPALYQQRSGSSLREHRVTNVFAFIQDDFRVSRSVTLNLGLRMEWAGGPTEVNGLISNLDLNNHQAYGAAGAGPLGLIVAGQPSFRSNTNWAPRVGFAWMTGGTHRTVIRGGYGMAYDFIFLNPISSQRFLPPFIATGNLSGQASFTGTNSMANILAGTSQIQKETAAQAGQLSTSALNFGAVSPAIDFGLRNPQVHQWNIGIQREQFGFVFKASYVGTKGNYLLRSRDINLLTANRPAPAASIADENARYSQFQTAFMNLNGGLTRWSNRLDPRYNAVVLADNSANSNYHGLQLEAQRRVGATFLLSANYTFAKSIDDGSDVLPVLINDSNSQQNPLDNRNNRGPSQFDLQHRAVFTHQWEPRWFAGSRNWAKRNLLGNWGSSGITSFRSGFPILLEAGSRRGLNPLTVIGGGGAVRPNLVSNLAAWDPRPAGSAGAPFGLNSDPLQRISTYAASMGLSQPLLGNVGNLGRNVVRLNGARNFDWSVYKNFAFTETTKLQFRAEFYNVFNNTSFQDASRLITATDFGQYTTVSQDARLIQLALRLVF